MSTEAYYESRTSDLYGGTIALVGAATIAVALRIVARRISAAKFWWDDWSLVLALIFDYGLSICYWLQAMHGGLGRHSEAYGGPVSERQFEVYFKIFLPLQIFYFASAIAIKTSLILLYYRLFGVTRWFRWELAFAWVVVILYFIVDVLVAIFECKPVSYFWDKSIPDGTCINQDQFFRWNGVANLLIDFMILTLTVPEVWRLKLKTRQKLSLTVVFLLGLFACVASIVRVITFNEVILPDITYTIVSASIWSTIEQSIGIICACLITYQPLLSRMLSFISGKSFNTADSHEEPPRASELAHLRLKAPTKSLSDTEGTAGFKRFDEAAGSAGSVTTNVTRAGTGEFPVVSEAILKSHVIEQHHEP